MKKYASLIFSFSVFVSTFFIAGCSFHIEQLPSYLDQAVSAIGGWGPVAGLIAGALELVVRLVPTANPWSILRALTEFFHALGRVSEALAGFLDKVLPQNLKG